SSVQMANTFKYILQGRTMLQRVAESCDFQVTAAEIGGSMLVYNQADTNIIIIRITTTDPARSYGIANGFAKCYQEVVNYAYPNATLQMYEEPYMPTGPDASTSVMRYSVIGAIIGFAVAFIAVIITNAVRDTVQTADDIQVKLESNLIGTIGNVRIKGKKKNKGYRLLLSDRTLGFAFIESYKAIRTKVETFCARKSHKVILVTSAGENEGKTTFSMNLALSLAQNGKSVLVIDADLRKPAVSKFLNLNVSPEYDLASVISGKTELSDAIKFVEKHRLFILTTAHSNDEPTEILSSQQMHKVIKAARAEFDYVIIDTAPAAVVTDANILSNFADAAILVVRENFSACARIRSVIEDISSNKAELIGCVFNNVASDGVRGAYSKYKYGYGYGGYGRRYGYGGYGYGGYGYGYGGSSSSEADDSQNINE
ncbi:MAG: polysaccharide biosynthesis tyrosine autokinase, partial [Clostridia bacterium]|nr:polysaccharide biosynthesis tyrosine autokinase [Clostridia bacterium]